MQDTLLPAEESTAAHLEASAYLHQLSREHRDGNNHIEICLLQDLWHLQLPSADMHHKLSEAVEASCIQ